MKKTHLIINLLLILIYTNLMAQPTDWINYTFAKAIWDFTETDDYYWAATNGGLVRINKSDYSIDVLTKANSPLGYNSVGPLCVDSQGNLWVGSQSNNSQEGGILKYNGQDWEAIDLEDGFWSTMISGLTADKNDILWFGMGQGIAKYDGNNVEYRQVLSEFLPYPLYLIKILFDDSDNVWFLDDNNRIRIFVNGDFNLLKGIVSSPYLEQDINGDFWIVENNHLKCFSGSDNIVNLVDGDSVVINDKIVFKDTIVPQNGDTVRFFYIDKNNYFYILFRKKMGILKNGNWEYMTYENSQLPDGSFHNLFADSTNNLWANVYIPNKGFRIYKYQSFVWRDITQQMSNSGLHDNHIKDLMIDDSNEKWIVGYSCEDILTNFNGTTWIDFDSLNSTDLNSRFNLKYNSDSLKIWNDNSAIIRYNIKDNKWSVTDNRKFQSAEMKIDTTGNIWWGTRNGLLKYNGIQWESYLDKNYISSLCFDQNNILYASTLPPMDKPGLLFFYNNDIWDTLAVCSDNAKWISSMTIDNENNLWFGVLDRKTIGHEYGDGLYTFNGHDFTHYHIYNSDIPGNSVVYVTTDIDKNIWVGTYGDGLGIFQKGNWTNYNASNSPLSGISVEKIIPDNYGNIWAGSQFSGITIIPYAEWIDEIPENQNGKIFNGNSISLLQNYPNPFNPSTVIKYTIPKTSYVRLEVFDILGKMVAVLVHKKQSAGSHIVNFVASNLSSGIYIYRLKAGNFISKKKMILLR